MEEVHVACVALVPDGRYSHLGLPHVVIGEANTVKDGLGPALGLGLRDPGAVAVKLFGDGGDFRCRRRGAVDDLVALGGGGGGSAGGSDTMGAEKEWTVGGGRGIDFRGGGQAKGHGRGESQRLHGYRGDGGRGGGGGLGSKRGFGGEDEGPGKKCGMKRTVGCGKYRNRTVIRVRYRHVNQPPQRTNRAASCFDLFSGPLVGGIRSLQQ